MHPNTTQIFFNQNIPVTLFPNNNNQFQEKKYLSRNISPPNVVFINPLHNNFQVPLGISYLNQNQNNKAILPYNTKNQIISQFPLLHQNNIIPLKQQNKDFNTKIN